MRVIPLKMVVPVLALTLTAALLLVTHLWWLRVAQPLADAALADDYAALVRVEAALDRLERSLDQAWFLGDAVAMMDAADALAAVLVEIRAAGHGGASQRLLERLERRLQIMRSRLESPDGHPGAYAQVQDSVLVLQPEVQAATVEARLAAGARGAALRAAGTSLGWISAALTLLFVFVLAWLTCSVAAELRRHDRRFRVVEHARRRVEHEADHDPLTGLANRRRLLRELRARLAAARAEGVAIAVHLLDLDGLKGINDRFGHAAGDEVLRRVAVALEESVRDTDLVGRLAGDEFVIVQADATAVCATALARRIAAAISRPIRVVDGSVIVASVSVGWALAGADGDTPATLLAVADRRLYADKAGTRSCWRVVPTVVHSA